MIETTAASFAMVLIPLLFFGIMAAAAISDLISYRIPNILPVLLLALFVAAIPLTAMSWPVFLSHLGAGLAMLAIGWVLFALNLLGGGDAKLFAAISLWMGWEGLANYLIIFSICGGVLALLLLMFRRLSLPGRLSATPWIASLHDKNQGVPYGIALAAGALLTRPELLSIA
ncbi:MAG: A24 family peptidase [Pseudomonadota bacterium]